MNYDSLNDAQKKAIIEKEYLNNNISFNDIAKKYNTYSNKVLRDAKKFNIKIRSKNEAQKNALKTGKHKHPTKGKNRSEEEKSKIGISLVKTWDNMDANTKEQRRQKARDQWNSMSDDEKSYMISQANKAVREASKEGSKLEKHILNYLLTKGIRVDFHKEQILSNTKLQIDLFLPKQNIAIEVDGPSHFEPIWGDDVLTKNKKYDTKKTGLILGKGIRLIRVKQSKDYSVSRSNIVCEELIDCIEQMTRNKDINYKELGD